MFLQSRTALFLRSTVIVVLSEFSYGDLHLPVCLVLLHVSLTETHSADRLIEFFDQMNRVEFTSCSTDTASKALVLINDGSSALEAALSLSLELLFCKCEPVIVPGKSLALIDMRLLSGCIVVADLIVIEVSLVESLEYAAVSSDRQAAAFLHKTID